MPRFLVTTTATATIRERFIVEAPDATTAEEVVLGDDSAGQVIEFVGDSVIGDETDREVEGVEAYTGESAQA